MNLSNFFTDGEVNPWEEGKTLYVSSYRSTFEDIVKKLSRHGFPLRVFLDLESRCVKLINNEGTVFVQIRMKGNFDKVYEAIVTTSFLADGVREIIRSAFPEEMEVEFKCFKD